MAPERLDAEIRGALRAAERHRAISDAEALALPGRGPGPGGAAGVADGLRQEAVGDVVTYVINRNINFTNVCYVGCRFCAFAQREVDPEAYTLTLHEVADRAEEAWNVGASEVCMQGDPSRPARLVLPRRPRRGEGSRAGDPRPRVQPDGGAERRHEDGPVLRSVPRRLQGARARHDPGYRGGDPRRRRPWLLTKGKLPADT